MASTESLRQPEVLTELGGCVASGMKWSALSKHLATKFGIKCNPASVKSVYETYLERRTEVIGGKKELKAKIENEVEGTIINTKNALKRIHVFVDDLIDRSRGVDDRLALDASREILNQLYFQEKLLNKMQAGMHVENVSKIEITQIVIGKLDQLQKEGRIKVVDTTLIGGTENGKTKDTS